MKKKTVTKDKTLNLLIEVVPIDAIKPYERNPRKNETAIDKVAASLREYGWRQPIVVDKDNIIVAGHTRYQAAKQLKMKEVPIHIARELTDAQIKAYRLMDNRSHEDSEWDFDLLPLELSDLKALDFDLSLTGFDEQMLNALNFVNNDTADAALSMSDREAEWVKAGMPEYATGSDLFKIVITFRTSEDRDEFVQQTQIELAKAEPGSGTWATWWPPKKLENPSALKFVKEESLEQEPEEEKPETKRKKKATKPRTVQLKRK